ncbi:hypothetical protein [Cupriavidus necator]
MNLNWTGDDEQMLTSLQERKAAYERAIHKPVEAVAEDILASSNAYASYVNIEELSSSLIEHADAVVAALQPFCKK